MTHFLAFREVLRIHRGLLAGSGGTPGVRDRGALESAVAQPRATFGGEELYPTLHEKAATLAFGIIRNQPFVDGNKRTGHAAMEVFLLRNGRELDADVDAQEQRILDVAAGRLAREALAAWVAEHAVPRRR